LLFIQNQHFIFYIRKGYLYLGFKHKHMEIKEPLRDQEIALFKKGSKIGFVTPRGEQDKHVPEYAPCESSGLTVHGSTIFRTNSGIVKGFYDGYVMCEYTDERGVTVCLGFKPCWIYLVDAQGVPKIPATSQPISRENLGIIYEIVCNSWKEKIIYLLDRNTTFKLIIDVPNTLILEAYKAYLLDRNTTFKLIIDVPNTLILEAYKAADAEQTKMLNTYFKRPKEHYNSSMLKEGEFMKRKDNGHILLRTKSYIIDTVTMETVESSPFTRKTLGSKIRSGTKVQIKAK